jgi:hypothetical protein
MTTTDCTHELGAVQRTGQCVGCGEQLQPPAPPPLPGELVELLELAGELLNKSEGDELTRAAIRLGVLLETVTSSAHIDERYPDLAPSWPKDVQRAAGKIRGWLGERAAAQ